MATSWLREQQHTHAKSPASDLASTHRWPAPSPAPAAVWACTPTHRHRTCMAMTAVCAQLFSASWMKQYAMSSLLSPVYRRISAFSSTCRCMGTCGVRFARAAGVCAQKSPAQPSCLCRVAQGQAWCTPQHASRAPRRTCAPFFHQPTAVWLSCVPAGRTLMNRFKLLPQQSAS